MIGNIVIAVCAVALLNVLFYGRMPNRQLVPIDLVMFLVVLVAGLVS